MPRSVTDAQKAAWLKDTSHKEMKLIIKSADYSKDEYVITNEFIEKESFSMKQAIMDDELELVGCISTYVSVTVHDVELDSERLYRRLLCIDVNADNTGWIRIFNGNIDSITKGSNRSIRIIEAYDSFEAGLNVDVTDWYNNHPPTTLRQLLVELCEKSGWAYDGRINNLPNGNMVVPCGSIHKVAAMTQTELFKEICQIAGCFGYITGDHKFSIYVPSQVDGYNTARIQNRYYTKLDYETYKTAEITHVLMKNDDSDPGMAMGQKTVVELIWKNVPENKTFASEDEYKAYYASNLTPYSALISDTDKYSSLATKDRYVFDVSVSQATMKELEKGDVSQTWTYDEIKQEASNGHSYFNATFSTGSGISKKNYDATFLVYQQDAVVTDVPRIWAIVVDGHVYCISDRLTGIQYCAEVAYIRSGTKGTDQWMGVFGGSSSAGGSFVGKDGHTYQYGMFNPNEFVLKEHNLTEFASLSDFTPVISESYTITPVGVTWDWTIEKAIRQVITATGMYIDYETPEVRKLISDTKNALISKGWGYRIGGIVVMPSEDWIANRQFADDCMQIMFDLGLYPISGATEVPRETGNPVSDVSAWLLDYQKFPHIQYESEGAEKPNQYIYVWNGNLQVTPNMWTVIDSNNDLYLITDIKYRDSKSTNAKFTHRGYYTRGSNTYWSANATHNARTDKEFTGGDGKTYYYYKYTLTPSCTSIILSTIERVDRIEDFNPTPKSGIRGTVIQEGCATPKKSSDSSYSVYGNDWQSYLYHSFPSKMVGMNKLNNYDEVHTAGASTMAFFAYLREWCMDKFVNEYFRDRFLGVLDRLVNEYGITLPNGLCYGIFSSSIEALRLTIVPSEYLAQGMTVSPSSLSSSDMVRSGQVFDYYFCEISGMQGTINCERRTATYQSYWGGYIAENSSISRAVHVDNYNTELRKVDISLPKLGYGDTQPEVWQGNIEPTEINVYVVQGNIFWYDATDPVTMLYNLFNEIVYLSDLSYRPFEASNPYMPWVEPGDQLIYNDIYDGDMTFRVFTKTVRGIQSMVEVNSAEGDKYQAVFTTSLGVEFVDTTQSQIDTAQTTANKAESDASDAIQRIITIEGQMPVEMTYTQTMSILEEE